MAKWVSISSQQLVDQANEVSKGLLAMGIKPGDKVGFNFLITDMSGILWIIGILQIGAINVPIYPTISSDDYDYIFNHAELKLVVVSSTDILEKGKSN